MLRDFTQQLENDMRAICDEMDIGIDIDLWMDEEPVPMNKELVATLTELCEREKLNYRVMHSGAGARRANFRASRTNLHDFYPQHQRDQP
ncbi:allantoate amidohydrolase [Escherichia coli]|uniref:Allantoate amidohydrolase n=1 Tax=Escherichia coli TaxID=562 RepID=A0A2X1N1F1_ECOLX|nr:allantoate amidohydrolase [Escherichia coli]